MDLAYFGLTAALLPFLCPLHFKTTLICPSFELLLPLLALKVLSVSSIVFQMSSNSEEMKEQPSHSGAFQVFPFSC